MEQTRQKRENAAKDADEIFTKYTIVEVKTLLNKLKANADAKQEELRLMVGERYRDLLHTSTSILSIAESSERVMSALEHMGSALNIEEPKRGRAKQALQSTTTDVHLHVMQSLAAHIKLLLDSSEHIWRLLERQQYFHAAWLFLLSRVVYQSLVHEDVAYDEQWEAQGVNVLEQFPIVQRQWDNIAHFRVHISQKATFSLRDTSLSSEDTCLSLLALYFLKSLPLLDALDVFLTQRLQALNAASANASSSQRLGFLNKSYKAVNGGVNVREKDAVKDIWVTFQALLDAIAQTLDTARSIFKETDGGVSVIRRMLSFIQSKDSQDLPQNLQITTKSLLSSLPSSNHFLSLPTYIIEYRPFVDIESPSTILPQIILNQKLHLWFTEAANRLDVTMEELQNLRSVKAVWELRSCVFKWLSRTSTLEIDEQEYLKKATDELCHTRVTEIWKAALDVMEISFRETLKSLAKEVQEGKSSSQAVSANAYILSAPSLPPALQLGSNISPIKYTIVEYEKVIKRKVDGRMPFVDRIISDMENATSSLRKDLNIVVNDKSLLSNVIDSYIQDADDVTERTISVMEDFIVDDEVETPDSIRKNVFVGHVAVQLALSTFVKDIGCKDIIAEDFRLRSQTLYSRIIDRWRKHVVAEALTTYRLVNRRNNNDLARPSVALLHTLLQIVNSWQTHNITNYATSDVNIRDTLLKDFIQKFSVMLQGGEDEDQGYLKQLFLDLTYIEILASSEYADCTSINVSIEKVATHIRKKLLSTMSEHNLRELEDKSQSYAGQFIKQIYHLLYPILPTTTPNGPKRDISLKDSVLKSAPPIPEGKEKEFEPAIELAESSSRFKLLLVGNPVLL